MPLMWTRRSPSGRAPRPPRTGRHAVGPRAGHDGVAWSGPRARRCWLRRRRSGVASKSRARLTSAVRTPASRRDRPEEPVESVRWRERSIAPSGCPGRRRRAERSQGRRRSGSLTRRRPIGRGRVPAPPGMRSRLRDRERHAAGTEVRVMQAPRTSRVVAVAQGGHGRAPRPGARRCHRRHRASGRRLGSAATPSRRVSSSPTRGRQLGGRRWPSPRLDARTSLLSDARSQGVGEEDDADHGQDGQAEHGQPEPGPDEAAAVPESGRAGGE